MKKQIIFVALMIVAIVAAGLLLNEAGKGTFGAWIKSLAKQTTNGYGAAA